MSGILRFHICSTAVLAGEGASGKVTEELKRWEAGRVMIVTDAVLSSAESVRRFVEQVREAGVECVLFDRITSNPKDYEVMEGKEVYRKEKCGTVIGIGGGSSLDAAKCIAAMARHEGDIMDYGRSTPGRKYFVNGRERLVLIPTTSGTGSEVSPHAVITNTKIDRKSDVMESIFYCDLIVLDSDFVMTASEKITRDTGIDALTHIIDSWTNRKMLTACSPFHDALAMEGIRLIAGNLKEACKDGANNRKARENMMWAATIGGFILDLDAGSIHGLAGVLQKHRHEMTHGESVGIMMPACMRHNQKACPERFKNIAAAMGVSVKGLTDREAGERGIEQICRLLHAVGYKRLKDFDITVKEIDEFYKEAVGNSCLRNNPVDFSPEEIRDIYLETLQEE